MGTVHVGKLTRDVEEDAVFAFFLAHNCKVVKVTIPEEAKSRERFKHVYAFAEMGDEKSVEKAIQLDGKYLSGRQITVTHARTTLDQEDPDDKAEPEQFDMATVPKAFLEPSCNVTLLVEGVSLEVPKYLLEAKSEVLYKFANNDMREGLTGVIDLPDKTLEEMVKFLCWMTRTKQPGVKYATLLENALCIRICDIPILLVRFSPLEHSYDHDLS